MENSVPFGEILEAADDLPIEDQETLQETLVEVLKSRLRDRRRAELAKAIQQADKEFAEGGCRPATPDELMREILP